MQISGYNIRPFVVTVQEMPEKQAFILGEFARVGLEVECFNGIHGTTSGLRTVWPYERDAPGSGWNMGTKPVATWLSFYMLWGALSLCPEPYFMTLEWDTMFHVEWKQRLARALADVPKDFDMLFVGSCCTDGQPKTHVKGEVYDVRYPQCGHATILSQHAVRVLLQTQRKVYAPLDISLMLHTLPLLKVYTILPRLCDQYQTNLPI